MKPEDVSVLVVDDVNAVRTQVSQLLKTFGFTKIIMTANGEEARLMLGVNQFHLILADWHMEPTDGLTLLKAVRGDEKNKDAAFIMVTADGTKDHVITAIQSGVDDYLVKPLTSAQIQNKVYRALFKRKIFQ